VRTYPPLGLPVVRTYPPLGLAVVRTYPPLGLPGVQTYPPLGLPAVQTYPPLGLPGARTYPPLGLAGAQTYPPLGLAGVQTYPPLGLTRLVNCRRLGAGVAPTCLPLRPTELRPPVETCAVNHQQKQKPRFQVNRPCHPIQTANEGIQISCAPGQHEAAQVSLPTGSSSGQRWYPEDFSLQKSSSQSLHCAHPYNPPVLRPPRSEFPPLTGPPASKKLALTYPDPAAETPAAPEHC